MFHDPLQPRLLVGCPEAVMISAYHFAGEGWRLKIQVRRQFQEWTEASVGEYFRLTTEELEDVVCSSLCSELEL